jgi:hypothetical protein
MIDWPRKSLTNADNRAIFPEQWWPDIQLISDEHLVQPREDSQFINKRSRDFWKWAGKCGKQDEAASSKQFGQYDIGNQSSVAIHLEGKQESPRIREEEGKVELWKFKVLIWDRRRRRTESLAYPGRRWLCITSQTALHTVTNLSLREEVRPLKSEIATTILQSTILRSR